jgi:hypothetical protein
MVGARESKGTEGDGEGWLGTADDHRQQRLGQRPLFSNSVFDLLDSCPEGVRHNVRKNSNFEFLKISNWVGHYIG